MAGLTIFLVKGWVGLSIGLLDELPFPGPGGHGLVKQGVIALMAADTAPGPIVTGRWMSYPFCFIPMT
jgi:hypothetical protein